MHPVLKTTLSWVGPPKRWLDPKGFRLWAIVLLLAYTLAGFFLAPYLVKRMLPSVVEKSLSRHASVDEVAINPYVLSVELRGFRLDDSDGSLLLGFKRLYVNFQTSSLFRWAWTFAEIRLDGVNATLLRDKDGETNIARLIDGMAPTRQPPQTENQSLPRLVVHHFALNNGAIKVIDRSHETVFDQTFGPINVNVRDLSTLPAHEATQKVVIKSGDGIQLVWNGSLAVNPVRLTGHVTVSGPLPEIAYQYLQDQLAFTVPAGAADIGFDYAIRGKPLSAQLSKLSFTLDKLQVRGLDGTSIASLDDLRIDGGHFSWPAKTIHADHLSINGLSLSVKRDKTGALNISQLLRDVPTRVGTPPAGSTAAPNPLADWNLSLSAFDARNWVVKFQDDTLQTPGAVKINDINANVRDISNKPGGHFPFDARLDLAAGGRVTFNGSVSALPALTADVSVSAKDLAVSAVQPWAAEFARVHIGDGKLALHSKITLDAAGQLDAAGGLSVKNLAVSDSVHNNQLLGWRSVTIHKYEYHQPGDLLQVSNVDIAALYANFTINKDHTTNVGNLMIPQPVVQPHAAPPAAPGDKSETKTRTEAKPLNIVIGRVNISDSSADYGDLSLPFPFHARIEKLHGDITTFATTSANPARVQLQGQVGNWGLAQVKGTINPLKPDQRSDIGVLFRNIDFPDLSPYTIKFAGRKIAHGRLDLNLHYTLDKGQMIGKNNIVIRDFELGDKVVQPGAMNLPLGLAVALLKGPDGKIALDLPVTGDVNDPHFEIGAVIRKVFVNVITKMVTSPFRLLAKLVGAGAEQIDQVAFEPGSANLSPPAKEKLAKLAQALEKRPNLNLQVPGASIAAVDGLAIRRARVDKAVTAQIEAGKGQYTEADRRAVESLFTEKFPNESLAALQETFTHPPEDDPKGKAQLDQQAYVASLRQKLIDAEVVTPADLSALADGRADAIIDALTKGSGIDSARIVRIKPAEAKPTEVKPTGAGWIPVTLKLDATAKKPVGQPAGN